MHKKLFIAFALLLILISGCVTPRLSEQTGYCNVPGGRIWYQIIGTGDKAPLICVYGGPGGTSCGYVDCLHSVMNVQQFYTISSAAVNLRVPLIHHYGILKDLLKS